MVFTKKYAAEEVATKKTADLDEQTTDDPESTVKTEGSSAERQAEMPPPAAQQGSETLTAVTADHQESPGYGTNLPVSEEQAHGVEDNESNDVNQVLDQRTQDEMTAVHVLSQCFQLSSQRFIPIVTTADPNALNSLQATFSQMPVATSQISPSRPGITTQTIQLPGTQTIQVPLNVSQMSALASATTDSGGLSSSEGNSTNTEAIIAAAAVAQEQEATLVTVHPAVIEAPVNMAEEQAHQAEDNTGDEDGKLKYTREICGHMREHASGYKQCAKCEVYGKIFHNAERLSYHMITHARKAFNNPRSRRVHQEKKPLKCKMVDCDETFRTPLQLARHIFQHTGEKPYKCEKCNKDFMRSYSLKRHYHTHTGEKCFKCDKCDYAFPQLCDLTRHKYRHSVEKPHKCDVCPKQFTRPTQLRDHRRTHIGENRHLPDTHTVDPVTDGNSGANVQAELGEAIQTDQMTVEASGTLGITMPAEIPAVMAAGQSHPHLLIATADQQLMQTQVSVSAEQQVLEVQAANGTIQNAEGISQSSQTVAQLGGEEDTGVPCEQLEQPMETD